MRIRAAGLAGFLAVVFAIAGPSAAAHPKSAPLAQGAPLDPLLERVPALRPVLDWLAARFGYVMGLACATPLAAILLWGFVIVPRRLQRWLKGLERSGWSRVSPDDPEVRATFAGLIPLYRGAATIDGSTRGDV